MDLVSKPELMPPMVGAVPVLPLVLDRRGEIEIDRIIVGERARKDLGDISAFAAQIDELGHLLEPVVVTPDGRLICGERRLRACQLLGWKRIPVRVVALGDIVKGELAENMHRKDFTPSEAVAIMRTYLPELQQEAAERMRAGIPSAILAKGRAKDQLAAFTGMKRMSLGKAAAIVEAAEAEPERFGKLLQAMDRTGRVNAPYQRLRNIRDAEAIRREPPPLPNKGPYRVITCDWPSPYDEHDDDPAERGVLPYPTMTVAEIRAVPVAGLVHEDSVLWFWSKNFHLANGISTEIVKQWGFTPITLLTWDKQGLGYGARLRCVTEQAIVAVRGSPIMLGDSDTTLLSEARMKEHSRKPMSFYPLVERVCPASRYLELFARTAPGWKPRPLWDYWGHEARDAPEQADEGGERRGASAG